MMKTFVYLEPLTISRSRYLLYLKSFQILQTRRKALVSQRSESILNFHFGVSEGSIAGRRGEVATAEHWLQPAGDPNRKEVPGPEL